MKKTYRITEGTQCRMAKLDKAEENFCKRYIPKEILNEWKDTKELRNLLENRGWTRREKKYEGAFNTTIDAIYKKGTRTITFNVYDNMLDD